MIGISTNILAKFEIFVDSIKKLRKSINCGISNICAMNEVIKSDNLEDL